MMNSGSGKGFVIFPSSNKVLLQPVNHPHKLIDLGDDTMLLSERWKRERCVGKILAWDTLLSSGPGHRCYAHLQKIWRLIEEQEVFWHYFVGDDTDNV